MASEAAFSTGAVDPAHQPGSHEQAAVDIVLALSHDELGIEVCRSLARAGKRLAAIWVGGPHDVEIDHPLVSHLIADPRSPAVLARAGVATATTILAISTDDQLNLRVALAARDLNPGIRIILRQFNRWLGRKIVANLQNGEAVSPETFAAATFAASILNPDVYQAIEFPRYSEQLLIFGHITSEQADCAGQSVRDLRRDRHWEILAIDERPLPPPDEVIPAGAALTFASLLEHAPKHAAAAREPAPRAVVPKRRSLLERLAHFRYDPALLVLFAALAALLLFATVFFHNALGLRIYDAFYFVMSTATTTGFGDITLLRSSDAAKAVGVLVMFGGIAITGTLLAYLTAAITRRSFEFAQGRHAVTGRGHMVVAGFGNVGARVAQYLLHAGQRLVVIDRKPDGSPADEVRAQGAHVMTADATSESAQEMARVVAASGLLAVTDSDSANLEIGLTALAYAPGLPIVMRIADPNMAKAVERHFKIRASYSAAALAAPLVTGLALEPGSRGTIEIAGHQCALAQRPRGSTTAESERVIAQEGEVELVIRALR
jgi:Trk K+ transport system NAD-binding subunit